MDVDAASQAISDGSLQHTMNTVIELLKPEATYFTTENGKRTAFIFFDLQDVSLIPLFAEPI